MFGKTPITALQEYCAKNSLSRPMYNFEEAADGSKSFVCIVEAVGEMAEGIGRSKKEAKHEASANIIKRLKVSHPDIEDIPQAPHESIPTSDAIADLRDYCIQKDHPLPQFEDVQHAGPPEAPEFTALCRVSTITRYATASTKKGAKQLAAQEILRIIRQISADYTQMEVAIGIDDAMHDEEKENEEKIKTYREYVESDIKTVPGTLLCDRHNYFKKLDATLRENASTILYDTNIISHKEKVHLLLNELKIKYKTWTEPAETWGSMVLFELLCDFDVLFAGKEDEIYTEIVGYFNDML